MPSADAQHREAILDQFTRQARPFAAVPSHSAEDSLQLLAETIQVDAQDEVLDVACGPGIVACRLAQSAKRVIGSDLVPAMLKEARRRQAEASIDNPASLDNLSWKAGDAGNLPFADGSFSLVVTRYSFHHFLQPDAVLREMVRVCRRGGRVAVADVTPDAGKTSAYDALEILRDPSHAHALAQEELLSLGAAESLPLISVATYRLEMPLETLLAASFPLPGNAGRVREKVRQDVGIDRLSVQAFERKGEVVLRMPITILVWRKP